MTFDWLKLHKSLSMFGRFVETPHDSIKGLQNDFCKQEAFTNNQKTNTSGWRVDSYLAFCRVMNYSFGFISELDTDNDYDIIHVCVLYHGS